MMLVFCGILVSAAGALSVHATADHLVIATQSRTVIRDQRVPTRVYHYHNGSWMGVLHQIRSTDLGNHFRVTFEGTVQLLRL